MCASGIPPEQIVVAGRFPARRLHIGEAGQQAPVQLVMVGGFQEGGGVVLGGAFGVAEEIAKGFEAGIVAVIRSGRGGLMRGKSYGNETIPTTNIPLVIILACWKLLRFKDLGCVLVRAVVEAAGQESEGTGSHCGDVRGIHKVQLYHYEGNRAAPRVRVSVA